ncbi:MAG: hypothetical protein AAF203_00365 [Pseudomonadota bacterium]
MTMTSMRFWITLLSFFLFVPTQASEMVGAVSAGLGGTGRTAVQSSEAVFLNPASLALMEGYFFGAGYQSGFTEKDVSRNTYSVVVTDGTAGVPLPGSIGYRRHRISDRGTHWNENEFKMGAGYRLHPQVSLGLAGSYLDAEGPAGQGHQQWNGDVGVLIGLTPNWGLSLNGENVIESKDDIPAALRRISRAALGTQYVHERFLTLRYEWLAPLYTENTQLFGHRFGLGMGLKSGFHLNVGYSVDDALAQNWSSAGLAWVGPRLKLAYSFQNENRSGLGTRHLVDLWFDL